MSVAPVHEPRVELVPREGQPVSAEEYEQLAVHDNWQRWELHEGKLREKPAMAIAHDDAQRSLMYQLIAQLDHQEFVVSPGIGRVARERQSFYLPDLYVIPMALLNALRRNPQALEVYRDPLPLVVEIWSPSTDAYDVDEKLPGYRARGDREIWSLHPFARTLKAWRRRDDGGYDEVEFTGGTIELHALPGVRVDVDALFVRDE
jgi:Uma2 family endonuclease